MNDPKSTSAPTMIEVAKVAGVSVATVSRVINGVGGVSPKLEKKVLSAMKKLHYHPSSLARTFKTQRSMLVGILIPLLEHPAYSRMASVIERNLFERGYRALICNSEEDETRENAYIEMLLQQRVQGIIINSSARNTKHLAELKNNNIPVVLFDRTLQQMPCNQVFCDNSLGGYTAMKHLYELGHRRIGIVAAPTYPEPIIRRIRGTREAIEEFGLDNDPALLVTSDTQLFDMGYQSAKYLLNLPQPPTAIFALTDVTAVGVMHAVTEMNLKIPQDISVIGYDDLPIASYTIPPLTTIAQPFVEMGEKAVELLLQQIENRDLPPEKAVLATRLVLRSTTAPLVRMS
jgi:LacI family transcriptional regulator